MVVSRRLSNPDGSFAGIAGAVLDQSYFSSIYRAINLGRDGAVMVINRNGTALVREPPVDNIFTTNYVKRRFGCRAPPQGGFGTYEGVSMIDGIARILGYQTVPGMPLSWS